MCSVGGRSFINVTFNVTIRSSHPSFLQLLFKYDLVKYDMVKDEAVKDPNGFCQRVEKGKRSALVM